MLKSAIYSFAIGDALGVPSDNLPVYAGSFRT